MLAGRRGERWGDGPEGRTFWVRMQRRGGEVRILTVAL
jgi:hypothetical protein